MAGGRWMVAKSCGGDGEQDDDYEKEEKKDRAGRTCGPGKIDQRAFCEFPAVDRDDDDDEKIPQFFLHPAYSVSGGVGSSYFSHVNLNLLFHPVQFSRSLSPAHTKEEGRGKETR